MSVDLQETIDELMAAEKRIKELEARVAALELRDHYRKHGGINPAIYGPIIECGGIPLP